MIIIRPVIHADLEHVIKLAFDAGIGMTSMPKNREVLEKKVKESEKAFAKNVSHPQDETYLFVLEDLRTGEIGGTCGIIAKTGRNFPLSFYQIRTKETHIGIGSSIKITPTLHVVHHKNHWSEICSLYLIPSFREKGCGKLLSLSRFLFMAAFPERFDHKVFAEMRGLFDENNISLFWEGIGKHFVQMEFQHLMQLRDLGTIDLSQVLPHHPIYIELLPLEVQLSIGNTHKETLKALQMLIEEGFQVSNEIDICDGGPKIIAKTSQIRSFWSRGLTTPIGLTS